jgi:hypothetical protein
MYSFSEVDECLARIRARTSKGLMGRRGQIQATRSSKTTSRLLPQAMSSLFLITLVKDQFDNYTGVIVSTSPIATYRLGV